MKLNLLVIILVILWNTLDLKHRLFPPKIVSNRPKTNKMTESTIIQKLINVGVYLEAGMLQLVKAEIEVKKLLEEYLKLKTNSNTP